MCRTSAQAGAEESPLTTLGRKRDTSRIQIGRHRTRELSEFELETLEQNLELTPLERGSQWVLDNFALKTMSCHSFSFLNALNLNLT